MAFSDCLHAAVVVIVTTKYFPNSFWGNIAGVTVLGRIKIRYKDPTVAGIIGF